MEVYIIMAGVVVGIERVELPSPSGRKSGGRKYPCRMTDREIIILLRWSAKANIIGASS